MRLQINPIASIDNTHLQGTIQATPAQLEAAFGEPEVNHPEDKVPLQWTLVNADGDQDVAVATVYLWKRAVPDSNQTATWNIGGLDRQAVQWVHDQFRASLGFAARAA